jgi:hypothetical protein
MTDHPLQEPYTNDSMNIWRLKGMIGHISVNPKKRLKVFVWSISNDTRNRN